MKPCPIFIKATYLDCLECEEKLCMVEKKKYKLTIIGVDQSYKDTGISIASDGALKLVRHVFLANECNNTARRKVLSESLKMALGSACKNSHKVIIICERIRLKSQGFINIDYIKSIGALNAVIVDTASEFGVKVYSVDTRSWKSKIVGTSKPKQNKYGVDPEKWPTILYVKSLGFFESILDNAGKRKKGVIDICGEKYFMNDNAADSACIALYGFLPKEERKLEEEH